MPHPTDQMVQRPYLVIPKLIDQPTWGGKYIVTMKGWTAHEKLAKLKIGQSYELFSGSNLSLSNSSEDSRFIGELTDRNAVEKQTRPEHAIPLRNLIEKDPQATLGKDILGARGANLGLLIKYTQALGNSFQVHIKDGVKHPFWKPKPESWYYFEPGLITLGVKPGIDWGEYQVAVTAIEEQLAVLSEKVKNNTLSYNEAQSTIASLIKQYDPWQFVNTMTVKKDQLIDLSAGGLHHSWEEDSERAPLGNVLYELQAEALDSVSTFRCFDKGKMSLDGSVRKMHIKEYFDIIDRTPEANDPSKHTLQPELITQTNDYSLEQLLDTRHYYLEKLHLLLPSATYSENITRFKHLFVKSGKIEVSAANHSITVTQAHSCFIPAGAKVYSVKNLADCSEVLISY